MAWAAHQSGGRFGSSVTGSNTMDTKSRLGDDGLD